MFPDTSSLFPPVPEEGRKLLDSYYAQVLDKVAPIKPRFRRGLPEAIADLSLTLGAERGDLRRDYMGAPATLNAYLRYFLPWNLYRLSRLFTGLCLDLPEEAVVADLGAGPLTLAQALWIARPELRARRLRFVCLDRTPKVMREGLRLFQALAGEDAPWRFSLVKGGLTSRLREKADLLAAVNVINETADLAGEHLEEWAERTAERLIQGLAPAGRILVVEPGVRRSGRILAHLRAALLERELTPEAPCPHLGDCPMPGRSDTSWCHFNFDARQAPARLQALSAEARLSKDNVSLSFLLFGRGEPPRPNRVRAVSETFPLPDGSRGQYACSARGLTLLRYAPGGHTLPLFPGQIFTATWPEAPGTDPKSGAVVLPMPEQAPRPKAKPEAQAAPPKGPRPDADKAPARTPGDRDRRPRREADPDRKPRREEDRGRKPGKAPARGSGQAPAEGGDRRPRKDGGKAPAGKSGKAPGRKPGKGPAKPSDRARSPKK